MEAGRSGEITASEKLRGSSYRLAERELDPRLAIEPDAGAIRPGAHLVTPEQLVLEDPEQRIRPSGWVTGPGNVDRLIEAGEAQWAEPGTVGLAGPQGVAPVRGGDSPDKADGDLFG